MNHAPELTGFRAPSDLHGYPPSDHNFSHHSRGTNRKSTEDGDSTLRRESNPVFDQFPE